MKKRNQRGMGLIVALAVLSVVALGLGAAAPALYEVITADNVANTSADLQGLKVAIAGNPTLAVAGGRSDFGYVGTMGNLPPKLSDLWLASPNTYSFDSVRKVGAGWIGPYMPTSFIEDLLASDKDRFGTAFVYTNTPFTRTGDGQTVEARIRSVGQDGIVNTTDDMWVDITRPEVFATVTGTLLQNMSPVKYAAVTLNVPQNGVATQVSATTDINGSFQFNNVAFGFRSLSVDPKLTFKAGSTVVTVAGAMLKFTITNSGSTDLTLTAVRVTYNFTAWYESIKIGNTQVFNYSGGNRAASGQLITFSSPVVVGGSGKPAQSVPLRVDNPQTTAPNVYILGLGQSTTVTIGTFKNSQTASNAQGVSVSGKTFTFDFTDGTANGSQVSFTVP